MKEKDIKKDNMKECLETDKQISEVTDDVVKKMMSITRTPSSLLTHHYYMNNRSTL